MCTIIRVLGLSTAMTFGAATATTLNTAYMTGSVDTESANNFTGFHLGDTWKWTMIFTSLGRDTFNASTLFSPGAEPNVWYNLTRLCSPTIPCVYDVLFQGPAMAPSDVVSVQFENGQLTHMAEASGQLQMVWDQSNANNRWTWYGSSGPLVSGPITSATATFTPEPGPFGLTAIGFLISAILVRGGRTAWICGAGNS